MISRAIIIISLFLNIYGNAQNKAVMKSPKRVENNKALDTLGYLKTFEANKAEYIGKNFSYLLSKMKKLQPQTIWSVRIQWIVLWLQNLCLDFLISIILS